MTIRQRLFLLIVVLLGAGFYFSAAIVLDDISPRYRESTEEPLVDMARVLAAIVAGQSSGGEIQPELFRQAFETVRSQRFSARIYGLLKTRSDLRVYVTDRRGIVVFDSDGGRDEGKDYSRWRDVFLTLRGQYGARSSVYRRDPAVKVLYIAAPVLDGNSLIGVVSVGKPTYNADRFTRAAQQKLILAAVLVCISLIALGLLMGAWITRPIQLLTDYARRVRDGKRASLPELGAGELRELGTAFEQMREALEGRAYVENYIQTLTHEIKSPLSAIRGAVELLEEDPAQSQRQVFLRNIKRESERIHHIVENLLLLSALEFKKDCATKDPVDLQQLIEEISARVRPQLEARSLCLQRNYAPAGCIKGDPTLLEQALLNLLQNAIDFSPGGGEIRVEVCVDQAYAVIEIVDQGPGIPEYARRRVFERFYSLKRPDSGRKSSGLGLTLVREIVLLHQGEVEILPVAEDGTRARIRLPV